MLQILESDFDMLINAGFIYLPLVFDPSVESEVRSIGKRSQALRSAGLPDLVEARGSFYVKSVSLRSLLENYATFDPETYEHLRRGVFNRFLRTLNPNALSIDEKLGAIVFQVLPYFARKRDKLHRKPSPGEEILDLINREIPIPQRYYQEADRFRDTAALQKKLQTLTGFRATEGPAPTGLMSARSLRQWFLNRLEARIIEEEKTKLGKLLHNRQQFANLQKKYIAVLLYAKERGLLEINGCGFFRNGATAEYFVYVHTGEFALKDFYGRTYLFPSCRVAVSTSGPLVPYVLDRYKHPFLKGFDRQQKICVRGDFAPAIKFSAVGAIQALEEGLNALFHGYNSKRGNGYHRLDGMKLEENSIVFEEFRIPSDDRRIVSGEVEVKNDFY